ncbi:MAG: hypothetical protein HY270_09790 [Deltaproteobacteria bacterium]|nr:hypothetical protein [Deltaproteobacteria bacterium]
MDLKPEKVDPHLLVAQYVDELRELMPDAADERATPPGADAVQDLLSSSFSPAIATETPKATWPWITALALTSVLALAEIVVLLLPPPELPAAPPPEVVALESADACLQRQVEIMDAIVRYAQHTGGLPERLAALGPPYLLNPWIDPVSGQPYEYQTDARSVSLTCPNPGIHTRKIAEATADSAVSDAPAEASE